MDTDSKHYYCDEGTDDDPTPLHRCDQAKPKRIPRVLNKHHSPDEFSREICEGSAVYIGRPTKYGNPFAIGRDGSRSEVIEKYRHYLARHPELVLDAKAELAGKDLVCWCSPLACHGDVLLEAVLSVS